VDGVKPLPPQDLAAVVAATAPLWPELRGGRVLITGATGFFGLWMLETLRAADKELELGVEIWAQSRDPAKFLASRPHLAEGIRWVAADPRQLSAEELAQAGLTKLDVIIHLVTEADGAATVARPADAIATIAGSTRRTLQVAAVTGARRMLFTSSGSVYRRGPERLSEYHALVEPPIDRTSALELGGAAKLAAEQACAEYARSTGSIITLARGFSFVGPGLPLAGKFALGNFLADAQAGRAVTVQGDGTPVRSYLYAGDLAVWLWTILFRGVAGRPYNVGSEDAVTLGELAAIVSRELAPGSGLRVLGTPDPARSPDRYVPDTRRARTELNLRETVPLAEALRRTAAWLDRR